MKPDRTTPWATAQSLDWYTAPSGFESSSDVRLSLLTQRLAPSMRTVTLPAGPLAGAPTGGQRAGDMLLLSEPPDLPLCVRPPEGV
jgi:hypothetical protein